MTIKPEDRAVLDKIGVKVPLSKSGHGTAKLSSWPDYGDLEGYRLSCKCPYCDAGIDFDEDGPDGDFDCPHCNAPLAANYHPIAAEVEVGVTLSPRLSETDRKYIAWKQEASTP